MLTGLENVQGDACFDENQNGARLPTATGTASGGRGLVTSPHPTSAPRELGGCDPSRQAQLHVQAVDVPAPLENQI
jgi:hypothetical protein